jgi:hypothetical protein
MQEENSAPVSFAFEALIREKKPTLTEPFPSGKGICCYCKEFVANLANHRSQKHANLCLRSISEEAWGLFDLPQKLQEPA